MFLVVGALRLWREHSLSGEHWKWDRDFSVLARVSEPQLQPQLTDILDGIIHITGDCPAHCRRLGSISGLYSPDVNSTPTPKSLPSKISLLPNVPGEQSHPIGTPGLGWAILFFCSEAGDERVELQILGSKRENYKRGQWNAMTG